MSRAPEHQVTDLEADLRTARDHDDRSYLLRALARSVVCLRQRGPGPPPGRPVLGRGELDLADLPLVRGRDGRDVLLAFTSSFALLQHHRDPATVWRQVPAGNVAALTRALPIPWFVDAAGPCNVVLQPVDVGVVADIAAGLPVREALSGGGASRYRFAPPSPASHRLDGSVADIAGQLPLVGVYSAAACFDEPRSAVWLQFALEVAPGADGAAAAARFVEGMEAASSEVLRVMLVGHDAASQWYRRHGRLVWRRPTSR